MDTWNDTICRRHNLSWNGRADDPISGNCIGLVAGLGILDPKIRQPVGAVLFHAAGDCLILFNAFMSI